MDNELKSAFAELRSTWESEFKRLHEQMEAEVTARGEATAETKAALDKVQEDLTSLEEKAQKRLDEIDAAIQTVGRRSAEGEASVEEKAFRAWMGADSRTLSEDEIKLVQERVDQDGGLFVREEIDAELLKGVLELSPVRRIVRVRSTGAQSRKFRKRVERAGAAIWTGETEQRSDTGGPRYGLVEVPTHELYAEHSITRWDIEDSAKDMEAELMEEWAEQFALAEGSAVVSGNGFKKPEGILTNADIESVASSHSTVNTLDDAADLFELKYALKEAYLSGGNLRLLFNRSTLKALRILKDANEQFIWQPALASVAPATIDGTPYVLVPDMPDIATGETPVAIGDFKRGYTLLDRRGTQSQRDPFTAARDGQVVFRAYRRLGGQVLLPEAIKKLAIA